MKIVGVGAGLGMLTLEAIKAIREAKLIYGSDRSLDLIRDYVSPGCQVHVIQDYKKLRELPSDAIVLSTGDPMLSGLGYLQGEVIPGISSLQVACARFHLSWLKVVPITAHGRRIVPEVIASEIRLGKAVFLLTDESTDLEGICRYLEEQGMRKEVVALKDLGYPEEKISRGSTSKPPEVPGLSCVLIGDL
jgi:cobalt-precorrin-7 (C5)-methyltransferase